MNLQVRENVSSDMKAGSEMKFGHGESDRSSGSLLACLTVMTVLLSVSSCTHSQSDGALNQLGGKRNDTREQAVIANMRTLRLAVETYALKHGKKYPTELNYEFMEYLPKGNGGGVFFNPYTNRSEPPIMGTVRNVQQTRDSTPQPLQPGEVEYSPIQGGSSYAIRGGGSDGKAVSSEAGPNSTLVLSSGDSP
jgi:type II secretory pathway pseudopilin PulG